MELEEEIKDDVFEEPYFVLSIDQERFNVVKSVIYRPGEDNNTFYTLDKENGELILGRDIKEEHTRRLNLLVEYSINSKHSLSLSIVRECQKFAKLCSCDYVGIERINGIYTSKILIPGYTMIQPRLFRKIIDN